MKGLVSAPRTVAVRATESYATTFAGQVLLQLLINTLCRQFGVVDAAFLDIPKVPVDRRAFPLPLPECANLSEQLLELGRAVAGHEIQVSLATAPPARASVTVLVGPGLEPRSDSELTLVAFGHGWDAFCSPVERSPRRQGESLVPFGSLLAACLASGMAFRHFHQEAIIKTSNCGLWDCGPGEWRGSGGPELNGVQLPTTHLVGLGAVGASFSLALASAPELAGSIIGIDPQVTDETGRNRLLSAMHADIELPKVAAVARIFMRAALHFYPNQTFWPDYAADPQRYAPAATRREEDNFRYAWVVSCVDRNIHRQNIARFLPCHVLSGSTDGLVAQATYYSTVGPCECLACNHPVPTFSMERFIDELKGLSPMERQEKYRTWGLKHEMAAAIDEYLHNPSCGQLAEAELRRLGVDGTTDWSVGFVSVAAGVMLAAYFARSTREDVDRAVGQWPERRLVFAGAQQLSKSQARRKTECPLCGQEEVRDRFVRRWQPE